MTAIMKGHAEAMSAMAAVALDVDAPCIVCEHVRVCVLDAY
jgi:hypothetical protein